MENDERSELLWLSTDVIHKNPENPRMIFDQDKLDILMESIDQVGILVPLIVYREKSDYFVLLDGERRWMCAKKLNLPKVPVNVISKPTKIENILRMFNIHNVREEWELMPTALKLGELMEELGITNERRLKELTSLTVGTIRRCKILLSLPKKYQVALLNREYKADFFIEMEKVLRKIESHLPEFYERYGRDRIIDFFVDMRKNGKIKNVLDFRLFLKVIKGEEIGLGIAAVEDLVEKVIINQEMDFRESYEYVDDLVNISKIESKSIKLNESIRTIDIPKLKTHEKRRLKQILKELRESIDQILRQL